jgi:hypothetical protein
MNFLLSLPLWVFLLVTISIIYGGLETGHWYGKRQSTDGGHGRDELGSLVAAMLGLLGFILAITFGTQLSRFDTGKSLLLDEANAIHTTWLRAGMMPAPYRDDARTILRDYVDIRVDADRDVGERIAESETLQSRLWEICLAGTLEMDERYPREMLLESLNELINLHEQRVTVSVVQHMPGAFWIVLLTLTVLTFGLAGYQSGVSDDVPTAARPIAVVGFSLLVLLIADLDRPGRGALQFDDHPLNDVASRMDAHYENAASESTFSSP